MSGARWLASPLAGTAGVLAGLCLLAIPLRKLTSARPAPEVRAAPAIISATQIPAVLRIQLLAPAQQLTLKTADGNILLDLKNPDAGESDHDVLVRFMDDELDLALEAKFGDETAVTAVFLTLMPDGYEEQTRYATGSGLLEETLRFKWHHEH